MIRYPDPDLLELIRNPDPQMKVQFDGDDRFGFALTLFSLLNPGVGSVELAEAVVESLEGSEVFPSLKGLRP
jgi:hypothetical protein